MKCLQISWHRIAFLRHNSARSVSTSRLKRIFSLQTSRSTWLLRSNSAKISKLLVLIALALAAQAWGSLCRRLKSSRLSVIVGRILCRCRSAWCGVDLTPSRTHYRPYPPRLVSRGTCCIVLDSLEGQYPKEGACPKMIATFRVRNALRGGTRGSWLQELRTGTELMLARFLTVGRVAQIVGNCTSTVST